MTIRNAEVRYVPGRKLKHLVRARNQVCTAPACNAQAIYCDLDHTVAIPRRPHGSVQPQPEVPPSPPDQTGARLEGDAACPRHRRLDDPVRPRSHRNPNGL